ncbi:hypothetical protein [Halodesulfovibrio aestuarii]|uniref:Uncharacterized protein n=1 Tax=Halodesulfovibrio aestuarii TaxID=126333 RepID=A0ABV4JQ11_9BACT
MQWKILVHNFWRHMLYACVFIACSCFVTGCAGLQKRTITPVAPPAPALAADEVAMRVDLAQGPQKDRIRKTRTQTMEIGERKTVVAGGDVLRILRYNEEVLELPKMSASKDFTITLSNPSSSSSDKGVTIFGYSNVTYEVLSSSISDGVILLDTVFAALDKEGRLVKEVYRPTVSSGVYKKIPVTVKPADVSFRRITRSKVVPESETHYVIKFVKKEGMSVLFEVRTLKGGSRPRVMSRKPVSVPLGTPIITIKGHQFKVHTITPDFIDIERLS